MAVALRANDGPAGDKSGAKRTLAAAVHEEQNDERNNPKDEAEQEPRGR